MTVSNRINLLIIILVFIGMIALIVSCDQADEVYFSSPSYLDQRPDTTLWDSVNHMTDSGINVVIECERGDELRPQGVIQGQHCYVDVLIDVKGTLIAGIDLLLCYNAGALSFQTAVAGELIEGCGWEYFSYRYGSDPESGLPSGVVHLVAIAEINNGANHPDCYGVGYPATIGELDFLISNDRIYEGAFIPITFCWRDCGDNTLALYEDSSKNEIYQGISRQVWESDGKVYTRALLEPVGFPSYEGAPDSCLELVSDHPGRRVINLFNGGVQIVCADSVETVGDVNLNGETYEIADAVLYANYFIHGESVFKVNVDAQIEASDVNRDGVPLTVQDLVYLINYICGTALPIEKINRRESRYTCEGDTLWIEDMVGGLYLKAPGEVIPTLLAENMEIRYVTRDDTTFILVNSFRCNSASGDLLYVPGGWSYIEAVASDGGEIYFDTGTEMTTLSATPNPFADSVVFSFRWPFIDDYLIRIYDVAGGSVGGIKGKACGIDQTVVWQTENINTGVFYARLYNNDRVVGSVTLLKGE